MEGCYFFMFVCCFKMREGRIIDSGGGSLKKPYALNEAKSPRRQGKVGSVMRGEVRTRPEGQEGGPHRKERMRREAGS